MSLDKIIKALAYEIKLELVSSFRYRFSIISDVLVFSILMGFMLSTGTGKSLGAKYNYDNYKELFLLGYIAWSLALAGLSASTDSITTELSRGTFYRKLNSKCPMWVLLFGELIASVVIHLIVIAVLCLLAYLVWDITIHISAVVLLALFINAIGMFGIGLVIAGFAIRYKRVNSLILLFQLGLLFITDTLPTSKLLLSITQVIPLTVCNKVIRENIAYSVTDNSFIVLLALTFLWLVVGYLLLNYHINKAKRHGTLLFY